MALNFPANPTTGQRYLNYVFTGVAWTVSANQLGEAPATGQAYVRDGATNQWLLEPANPNKLINPFMQIDQANEGTILTIPNGGVPYIVDGFRALFNSGSGVAAGGRSVGAPPGYTNSASVWCTTPATSVAAGDFLILQQSIEANELEDTFFGTAEAVPLTLSFYAMSVAAGTYYVNLRNSAGNRCYVAPFILTASTVWQLFNITIPGDIAGSWTTSGNDLGMNISWTWGCGTTNQTPNLNTWQTGNFLAGPAPTNGPMTAANAFSYIGPVKLEVGSTATPMLRTSFQQELARCQRYYEKSYNPGIAPGSNIGSTGNVQGVYTNAAPGSNTLLAQIAPYKVTKRAIPTVTTYAYSGASGSGGIFTSAWTVGALSVPNNTVFSHAAFSNAAGIAALAWDFVADARL